jgi:hypothetical protein
VVGSVRDLARRPRHLGRHRRAASRPGIWVPAPPRGEHHAVHGLRRARAARRPGDRPRRQLVQPGALRRPDVAAVGPRDRPRAPPGRLPERPTFHPTFLYEIIWNLGLAAFLVWLGHHRRIRPPGCSRCTSRATRSGASGEELLRVDPPTHLRAAAELLRRDRAVHDRDRVGSCAPSAGGRTTTRSTLPRDRGRRRSGASRGSAAAPTDTAATRPPRAARARRPRPREDRRVLEPAPMICSPTGRPSSPKPIGTDAAGWPVRFAGRQNVTQSSKNGSIGSPSIARATASRRAAR